MTKRLFFIFCLCLAALTTQADEERKMRLSDDHSQEMLQFGFCNVFITKGGTDANGTAPLTIEVENSLEDQALLIFHVAYSEKGLKGGKPQITFWKNFPGTHDIEDCDGMTHDLSLRPSDKVTLPMRLKAGSDSPAHLVLPIYIAKDKKKDFKKLELREKLVLTLDIEVETGPSKEYLDLESRCNELVKEIKGNTFCNNPKHTQSLEEQEAPYREKAEALNDEIEQAIRNHDLKEGDAGYEKYNTLRNKLKDTQFTESSCKKCAKPDPVPTKKCPTCGKSINKCRYKGNHPSPGSSTGPKQSCKYCSLSLSQIYQRLNDCYVKIHTRKATKQQVIGEANALYNCASQHSSEWKSGSSVKSKIQQTYNRIKSAK